MPSFEFTYLNTRGYHPLLAVLAESGEVVHSRLRQGKASAAGRSWPPHVLLDLDEAIAG